MSLDVHHYDSYIHQNLHQILKDLPEMSLEEENYIWNIICQNPIAVFVSQKNDIDPNANSIRCRNLGARVFKKIMHNKDLVECFYQQFFDMYETNGFCPQGQTNRYIQVYEASR